MRRTIARLLPPDTVRAVAPPGRLHVPAVDAEPGRPPIVVASLMRTGTHLLIDLILNNFPVYRGGGGSALYCDLDRYTARGLDSASLDRCEAQVLKTHVPQLPARGYDEAIARLAARSRVLALRRDYTAMCDAYRRFAGPGVRPPSPELLDVFEATWNRFGCQWVAFDDFLCPDRCRALIDRLAGILDEPSPDRYVLPPDKAQLSRVLLLKAGTRLLGARMKTVNTTVAFSLE